MAIQDRSLIKALINDVIDYAVKQISDTHQHTLFSNFVRLFYSQVCFDDLKDRPLSELFGMVYSHWQLVCQPPKGDKPRVRVFNPILERDGWYLKHAVVQVMMRDMPFIVDSVRMEMNRLGYTIHLMIHMGGMKICRDTQGKVISVESYDAKQVSCQDMEAPVYLEMDRKVDASVLLMIEQRLYAVLNDVQATVDDWNPMQARVREAIAELSRKNKALPEEEIRESIAFLQWLLDGQFTFLGVRDYVVQGAGDNMALALVPHSGLGILHDESKSRGSRLFSEILPSARESMLSTKQLLVISKTNTISTVHRQAYTDYIGIKHFDEEGKLIGERRIIGLYTSTAYSSHPKQIPFLRHKVASLMHKSGLPPKSHAGKDLMHILETFPRDDLFQAPLDALYRIVMGILNLQDRKKLSLFVREDTYGRYVSCLVFLPRDNFNSQLIMNTQDVLMETFSGDECSYATYFYTPILTRIHYIIRLKSKKKLRYDVDTLQARLSEVAKSWQDKFKEAALEYFGEESGNEVFTKYRDAFSAGYREAFLATHALIDVKHIESLRPEKLGMSLYRPVGLSKQAVHFKLYQVGQSVSLSDALPILENMGLRVQNEQAYQITFSDHHQVWISDFSMSFSKEFSFEANEVAAFFQEAFHAIWAGEAENDLLNALVLEAQLSWREIAVLRAYTKYLKQVGFTYSQHYLAETFVKYPHISALFIRLFHRYFDPSKQNEVGENSVESIEAILLKQIDEVALLDEDRIFRRALSLLQATWRTNFYQKNKSAIAFKLSPEKIPELPLPLPKFEIFVYSPRFEGVHLRSSKVARGGLRWSDRREDFRTEVLGLMKAQQVKNSVIVPSGAKGGFVPKNLPVNGSREAILQEAIACYRGFIQSLLDVTDNRVGAGVVRPIDTVCYDDEDPYLVVAADKGTATFSDIANEIAIQNDFWLGDAFASGGSTGYDHKKIGITARGAWVSAKRHFQGLGIPVDQAEITAVGIGDLSGDVFGNGVLLSSHLKLVAAFNHMHIFLDPNPNAEISFKERQRLFALQRSTWADYNVNCISTGGGVFLRSAKIIALSDEVRAVLDIVEDKLSPNELIRAILKAPVDLIWNGGIGTYVKSSDEENEAVGDRANDSVRVNGADLRSRVVVEGGNLGFTQLGRIEYALLGGLINTDFIDNSGGVDCSDHEVNIKILLNAIVESGDLTMKQRNQLLVSMTDEVAALVLQNNYHQNETVSFLSHRSPKHMGLYARYLEVQEQAGRINRELEYLPSTKSINERRSNEQGLTRPEIAVLFSYSKIILKEDILQTDLLNDEFLMYYIQYAFPGILWKKYSDAIAKHRLRNEILATQIANQMVSIMGITFTYRIMDETGASVAALVRAFVVAFRIFDIQKMFDDIDALDYAVDMTVQYQMMDEVRRLVRRATRWILRNYRIENNLSALIEKFALPVQTLYKRLPKLLLGGDKAHMDLRRSELIGAKVPEEIATRIAAVRSMYHALNIIQAAIAHDAEVYSVAQIYFILVDRLDLHWFRDKITDHAVTNRWSVLAKAAFKGDLDWIQRELTAGVLESTVSAKTVQSRVDAWLNQRSELIARWQMILSDLRNEEMADFAVFSVAIRELFDLARAAQV